MIKNNRLIDGSFINGAEVTVDILPKGHVVPDVKQNITHITIHNTGGYASAKNNHTYMKRNNTTKEGACASWHLTIDEKEIYQAQSFNYKMWHAGDKRGNSCSVGIEVCQSKDPKIQEKIYRNAIALVKELMKEYNLGIDKVVKHQHWSGKKCPDFLIRSVYGFSWDWFIKQCKIKANTENTNNTTNISKLMIDGKEYNVEAFLIDGRTYIKLRDFEQAGYKVDYDEVNHIAMINKPK